jgi:hypothetical protein
MCEKRQQATITLTGRLPAFRFAPSCGVVQLVCYLPHLCRHRVVQRLFRRGFCIFCGGVPLTREHIWADWFRAYLPRTLPFYHSSRIVLNEDNSQTRTSKKISGDPKSRKLRIVCKKCNNEWMSDLQNATKPILIPLLRGRQITLSEPRQRQLATWVATTVICAEYLQPASVAMPVTGRRWLFTNRTPPDNMRIWIGNFDRQNWKADWAHNSLRISDNEGRHPGTVNPDGTPRPNTQTITYVAGKLYIHAFTCPFPEILNSTKLTGPVNRALVQIWPIRHTFIAWQLPVLTDSQADTLAAYIFRSLDVSGKAFGAKGDLGG